MRRDAERDRTASAWLDSRHTFAFGTYDRVWSGLGPLKVLNEDRIAPGHGFGLHPHWDMEIVTCVMGGALCHEDSLGQSATVRAGEVQYLSAGTGIEHAERNASDAEPVHLFQIWITPAQKGLPPRHRHAAVPESTGLTLLAGPEGAGAPLEIRQDIRLYRGVLPDRGGLGHELRAGQRVWLQVARGAIDVDGVVLGAGDGAAVIGHEALQLTASGDAWFLLFDVGSAGS